MKKFAITFVILTAISGTVYAGPLDRICGGKSSQREVDTCVQYAVNGGSLRMQKNYDRIGTSANVNQEDKNYVGKNHKVWSAAVDKKCQNNVCVYEAISDRNDQIEKFMRERGLQPH